MCFTEELVQKPKNPFFPMRECDTHQTRSINTNSAVNLSRKPGLGLTCGLLNDLQGVIRTCKKTFQFFRLHCYRTLILLVPSLKLCFICTRYEVDKAYTINYTILGWPLTGMGGSVFVIVHGGSRTVGPSNEAVSGRGGGKMDGMDEGKEGGSAAAAAAALCVATL